MTDKELQEKLDEVRKDMKIFDTHIMCENWMNADDDERYSISKSQAEKYNQLFELFKSLNWQLALNSYKKLNINNDKPMLETGNKCGTPVKIKPCNEEKYGKKTYFGILIGSMAQSISAGIDKEGNLDIYPVMHNPAIFVPELGTVIYGCESWWGKIEKEEDLKKLITDETIKNVWYIKLLTGMGKKDE